MRRTQLYLDDQLWGLLHAHARSEKTTVSDLVRRVVRERYVGGREERMAAMQEFVGNSKALRERSDIYKEIRKLRRGSRLDRLGER